MGNVKCVYYVEGLCEKELISALKEAPCKILQGKVRVFNVIQNLIPRSQLLALQSGTVVVFVFDTDTLNTATLQKNIEIVKRYCRVKIVYLAQVINLEDELVRCTNVRSARELTQSNGVHNFKSDFCKLKAKECRDMLERHHIDVGKLWTIEPPSHFSFVEKNSSMIKVQL